MNPLGTKFGGGGLDRIWEMGHLVRKIQSKGWESELVVVKSFFPLLWKPSLDAAIKYKNEVISFSAFFTVHFKRKLVSIVFPVLHSASYFTSLFWLFSFLGSIFYLNFTESYSLPRLLNLFFCHFPRIKEVKLRTIYFRRKEGEKEKQTWVLKSLTS